LVEFNRLIINHKTLKIFPIAFIIALSLSCGKSAYNNPTLPLATQTGANTMGAYINGKLWLAQPCLQCINGGSGLRPSYSTTYSTFNLLGECENPNALNAEILLNIENLKTVGTYTLSDQYTGNESYGGVDAGSISPYGYQTNQVSLGTVTITRLDTVKHIVSGVFSMKAQIDTSKNSGPVITVTDGRFDVTY